MRRLFGNVLWILVLGGLAYGGYVAYERWWQTGVVERIFKDTGDKVKQTAEEELAKYGEEAKQAATGYVKQKIAEGISTVGEEIQSAAGSIIGESGVLPTTTEKRYLDIGDIGGGEGVIARPTSSRFSVPPPPVAVTTKVGVPLIFSLNSGVGYTIQWGDGTSEKITVGSNQSKLASHTWKRVGDYTAKITASGVGTVKPTTTSFSVRVYE
ncbi:hypothetical protein HY967_03075 [Candidatus Jorgensenbacteria bacterium]|nr:hypothetical protein [Candidatus Jorgensenbacteria bacterium]